MTLLSVNLNKIALVRNTRTLGIPSVVKFARIALAAGAQGITIHPRPDGRHIRPHDVSDLADALIDWPNTDFNIEGNPFHGLLEFVRKFRPQQCTLVPDESGAATSDHGWNLSEDGERLRPIIAELRALDVRVSLFMNPDPLAMPMAQALGADRVELYTEPYASSFGTKQARNVLDQYVQSAIAASRAGLGINAGHDLNLANLPTFLRAVPNVLEVSIGHALVADAFEFGMEETVRMYLAAIREGRA